MYKCYVVIIVLSCLENRLRMMYTLAIVAWFCSWCNSLRNRPWANNCLLQSVLSPRGYLAPSACKSLQGCYFHRRNLCTHCKLFLQTTRNAQRNHWGSRLWSPGLEIARLQPLTATEIVTTSIVAMYIQFIYLSWALQPSTNITELPKKSGLPSTWEYK